MWERVCIAFIVFSVKVIRTFSSGFNEGTFGTTAHVNVVRSRLRSA